MLLCTCLRITRFRWRSRGSIQSSDPRVRRMLCSNNLRWEDWIVQRTAAPAMIAVSAISQSTSEGRPRRNQRILRPWLTVTVQMRYTRALYGSKIGLIDRHYFAGYSMYRKVQPACKVHGCNVCLDVRSIFEWLQSCPATLVCKVTLLVKSIFFGQTANLRSGPH